ncbi:GntR family transcriptional regulator [Alkalihalobacillus oceani]|uniref:GntR family transcriptional regulator n=1 Tax=Halalkalibacter oceani TaxID=1653776 RepID=UPI00203A4783|nr:GntR family transcriptional regulator [Halalkalibacter oceani]MCM3760111.1 GntR family transcriptional regulator [Halalkalibacter oceani]
MPENDPLRNTSLSHQIAEKITNQIMSGELQPGEKIIEANYAKEFGTSRAPIRESLYLLATDGLIERIPRRGAVVKGYSEMEVYDLLELRMMLEGLAMKRLADLEQKQSTIKQMEDTIKEMDALDSRDDKAYALLNQTFHLYLIEMSGSKTIKDMYTRLSRQLLVLQRMSFLEEAHVRKSIEEHKVILDLIKKGLVEEARVILDMHNQGIISRIEQKIFPHKK